MTEVELLELLALSRTRDLAEQGESKGHEHPGGLTFARARALVLNPGRGTEAEQTHVSACSRCARLLEDFERNMVHPSWWELLCHVLGKETVDEAQAMHYHLEDGECQRCRQVVASLRAESLARLADWFARRLQAPPPEEEHPSPKSNLAQAGEADPGPAPFSPSPSSLVDARQQIQGSVDQVLTMLEQLGQADMADLLRQRSARMTARRFRLAVVGEYNCGKTTLINALLGREVLPTSPFPCTSVITTVHWSDQPRAALHFRHPLPATLPGPLPRVVRDHIRAAEGRAVPPLDVPVDHLHEFITFTGPTSEVLNWSDSSYARAEIGWPLDLCREGAEISDTPGLEEYGYRDPFLLECVRQADAVAFVMSCTAIARQSEMRLLEQLRGLGLSNVFLICNRIDQIRPADRDSFREFARARFARFLKQTLLGTDALFFLSALDALEGHLAGSRERVDASGLPDLARALMRSLITDRESMIAEQFAQVLSDVQTALSNRLQGPLTKMADLERQLHTSSTRLPGERNRSGAEATRN